MGSFGFRLRFKAFGIHSGVGFPLTAPSKGSIRDLSGFRVFGFKGSL